MRTITGEEIELTQRALNLRPRKCLGFRQPGKMFEEYLRAA
jgi:transposase, IS30 family